MKKGYLYFHQGWTDIICQLSLVNYYKNLYDELTVVMRDDSKNLFDFYIRNLPNVISKYIPTCNGRYVDHDHFKASFDYDWLFHGHHDLYRNDKYRYAFTNWCDNKEKYTVFIEGFYICYDIDYNTRVECFHLDRDLDMESSVYEKFKKLYGKRYIIYHDDEMNHIHGPNSISTKIDFPTPLKGVAYVNLNKTSYNFFDYLTVIHNAEEIHLVDSVWAAMCYQMDAKYGTFANKTINLYAKRGHKLIFTCPKNLKNWNII